MGKKDTSRLFLWCLTVAFFLSTVGCAGTTSSGTNRLILSQDRPTSEQPYRLEVSRESRSMVCGTTVHVGPMPTSFAFALGGVGGILGAWFANAVIKPDKMQGKMRGAFLAGEAFEEAASALSCNGQEPRATIELDVVRFEPVFSSEFAGVNRVLTVGMEWVATIDSAKGAGTRSAYICRYALGTNEMFMSGKEKDVLREMLEHALANWVGQVKLVRNDDGQDAFPESAQGELHLDKAGCTYEVFVPNVESDSK